MNTLKEIFIQRIIDIEKFLLDDEYCNDQKLRLNLNKKNLEKTLTDEQAEIFSLILEYLSNINNEEKTKIYKVGLYDGLNLAFDCRL